MPSFGEELLAAAKAYSDSHQELKLPPMFEQSLRQLIADKDLLPACDFEDPDQTENTLVKFFESSYRCAHREGGSNEWKNRSRCHGEMESAAREWIQTNLSESILAALPEAGDVEQVGHAPVDVVISLDNVAINFATVKNGVMAHVHQLKSAPEAKETPVTVSEPSQSQTSYVPHHANATPTSSQLATAAS